MIYSPCFIPCPILTVRGCRLRLCDARDRNGRDARHYALASGHFELARYLAYSGQVPGMGPDVDAIDGHGLAALHKAVLWMDASCTIQYPANMNGCVGE